MLRFRHSLGGEQGLKYLWLIAALPLLGFSNPAMVRTAHRTFFDNGHRYLVEYLYAKNSIDRSRIRSSMLASEKIHYEAEISVYEIRGRTRTLVSKPFGGEYTELGCIEDDPAMLVHEALESAHRERAMDGSARTVERR